MCIGFKKLPRQYTVLPSSDDNRIRAYYRLCVNDRIEKIGDVFKNIN